MSENPYQSPQGVEEPPKQQARRSRWRLVGGGAFAGFFFGVTFGALGMVAALLMVYTEPTPPGTLDPDSLAEILVVDITSAALVGTLGGGMGGALVGVVAGIAAGRVTRIDKSRRFYFTVVTAVSFGACNSGLAVVFGADPWLWAPAALCLFMVGLYGGALSGRYLTNLAWGKINQEEKS